MSMRDPGPQDTKDVLLSVVVMLVYFAYMLTIAFAPKLFAAPIATGSPLSIGLASGIGMAVFMVAFSAWYTQRRNKLEEQAGTAAKLP